VRNFGFLPMLKGLFFSRIFAGCVFRQHRWQGEADAAQRRQTTNGGDTYGGNRLRAVLEVARPANIADDDQAWRAGAAPGLL
jgi:hypothetical protein